MARLHLTPEGPKPCTASVMDCPYGSQSEHFTNEAAAWVAYESKMEREHRDFAERAKTDKTSSEFGLGQDGFYGEQPPREVQIDALNATAEALKEDGVTQLVAACGTGKSYMGRQLMREMLDQEGASGTAIALTSSIKLAQDTAADLRPDAAGRYDGAMGEYGKDYEVIEVHSDNREILDPTGSISTEKIAEKWKTALDEGKKVVVVSTYNSASKVQEAQSRIGDAATAELLMNDEAHNILGQKNAPVGDIEAENSGYRSFDNGIPGAIQSNKRLYATATPILSEGADDPESVVSGAQDGSSALASMRSKAAEMENNARTRMTVYSDDEVVVGKISGAITKQQAVDTGCLADSQYHMRSAEIKGQPMAGGRVDASGNYTAEVEGTRQMTPQTYAAVSSTLDAMAADPVNGKNPTHNALAYCGSIDQAEAFQQNFRDVALARSGGMSLEDARANVNSEDESIRSAARMRVLAEDANVLSAHSRNTTKEKRKAFGLFKGKDIRAEDVAQGWSGRKNALANVDIFSEGVSINEIDTVVIADSSKTSEKAMTQAIGRAARVVPGNDYKTTGHVIIPQAVSSSGEELNGGLVAQAAYGATRVERGVSIRKLHGEDIPADESTVIERHGSAGSVSVKAASIARSHVNSADSYVASQVLERADLSLRSSSSKDSPERQAAANHYRSLSKSEQLVAMQQKIKDEAKKNADRKSKTTSSGDGSWEIADRYLSEHGNAGATRSAGRTVSSALAAGDFSAVSPGVVTALSKAGVIHTKEAKAAGPTTEEKRRFLEANSGTSSIALSTISASRASASVHAVVTKGVDDKLAVKEVVTGIGGSKHSDKAADNFKSALSSDDFVNEAYSVLQAERGSSAPDSFTRIIQMSEKKRGGSIYSDMSGLESVAESRTADSAASGSAGFEIASDFVTKTGQITANGQRRIAAVLDRP